MKERQLLVMLLQVQKRQELRSSLELLHLEAWWQGLLQLLGLLLVGNLEGVKEPRAANLELNIVSVLLDLHALGVLPAGFQQELLDLLDLPRHFLQYHIFSHLFRKAVAPPH